MQALKCATYHRPCAWHGLQHGLFAPEIPHPRFIVTGGAGFIGSHLVRRLRQIYPHSGQIKVVDSLWRSDFYFYPLVLN